MQQAEKLVTRYFASLKKVYEELNVVLPILADVRDMQKQRGQPPQREQVVVIKFLGGLRPEFQSVRS